MSEATRERLYSLLPAVYRLRDSVEGEPLRALLAIIEDELEAVRGDIDDLYENWFIETCADWVIPYIGDLVGNRPLHETPAAAGGAGISQLRRTDVAKTIYYRRRKGALAMLEEMARDVTGWGAHAVEFFQLLGWTQHLNHQRYRMAANPLARNPNAVDRVGAINLRSMDVVDRVNGPFDVASHTVDVRTIGQTEGWHNIRHVGFFLWRLHHYPLKGVTPRQSAGHPHGYHFSPLGAPAPLFNRPQREGDAAGLAGEVHTPGPIRPRAFHADLQGYAEAHAAAQPPDERPPDSDYYGPGRSLHVIKDGDPVPPMNVMCKNLSNWDRPPSGYVAVDVQRGRLTFALGEEPAAVEVAYSYGFSADLGGGPYDRRRSLTTADPDTLQIVVAQGETTDTLQKALQEWSDQGKPRCAIRIADSRLYEEAIDVQLPRQGWLALEAASGVRPHLRLPARSTISALGKDAAFTANGLLIEGGFELNGPLTFALQHCTLTPGRSLTETGAAETPAWDSLVAGANSDDLTVTIDYSITGPIRLPATSERLTIRDSIVQAHAVEDALRPAIAADGSGDEPGPPATLERSTIWGPVHVRELTLASEVIFAEPVRAQRRQVGCVRFSFAPDGSQTPRRYRCQPDLALLQRAEESGVETADDLSPQQRALVLAQVRPEFTSERYGDPGYAQLSLACAEEIRTGAEDGSEIGAFSHLKQPQREANLRIRLDEYLPFGLRAGLIYVT